MLFDLCGTTVARFYYSKYEELNLATDNVIQMLGSCIWGEFKNLNVFKGKRYTCNCWGNTPCKHTMTLSLTYFARLKLHSMNLIHLRFQREVWDYWKVERTISNTAIVEIVPWISKTLSSLLFVIHLSEASLKNSLTEINNEVTFEKIWWLSI